MKQQRQIVRGGCALAAAGSCREPRIASNLAAAFWGAGFNLLPLAGELIASINRANDTPKAKLDAPLTSAQEYGWEVSDEVCRPLLLARSISGPFVSAPGPTLCPRCVS